MNYRIILSILFSFFLSIHAQENISPLLNIEPKNEIEFQFKRFGFTNWFDYSEFRNIQTLLSTSIPNSQHSTLITNFEYGLNINANYKINDQNALSFHLSENLALFSKLDQASINRFVNGNSNSNNDTLNYSGSFLNLLQYKKVGLGINHFERDDTLIKDFRIKAQLNTYLPNNFINLIAPIGIYSEDNQNFNSIYSQTYIYGSRASAENAFNLFQPTTGFGLGLDFQVDWMINNNYKMSVAFADIGHMRFENNYQFLLNHDIEFSGINILDSTTIAILNDPQAIDDTIGFQDTTAPYIYRMPSKFDIRFTNQLTEKWLVEISAHNYFRFNVPINLSINMYHQFNENLRFSGGASIGGFGTSRLNLGLNYQLESWEFGLQSYNIIFMSAHSFGIELGLSKSF